jgi:ATP-dependent helicase/nuclease subunit B
VETAGELFPSPLKATVTQIESFASCPFQHFARYALDLQPRAEQDVTRQDLGKLYHDILHRMVRQLLQQGGDWPGLPAAITDELIGKYAAQVGEALRGELMLSSARNRYLLEHIRKTLSQVIAQQRAAMSRGTFRPAYSEIAFGEAPCPLPPYRLASPQGRQLELAGRIDRVDLMQGGANFAIIDYKLSGSKLSLARVYHGLSLQLLSYLLVLQANGQKLAGRALTPAAAFYVQLLRKLEDVAHPDKAVSPEDEKFALKIKPRGIFDERYLVALDKQAAPGRTSDVVHARLTSAGKIGYSHQSDAASSDQMRSLLDHVKKVLGQLTDQIASGVASVTPYRMNLATPCPLCPYRSVCRFDTLVNSYHRLGGMKRDEVLQRLAGGGDE